MFPSVRLAGAAVLAAMLALPALAAPLENIVLSTEENGEAVTRFATDTPVIHLAADITDEVSADQTITVSWVSVDSGGAAPANYEIKSLDLEVGTFTNRLKATLTKPTNGWPVGTYQVRLSVDGEAAGSADFAVE